MCGEVVDVELFCVSSDERRRSSDSRREEQTFMSMRTSCLFRLGAVRRLPVPDGSWKPDSTSDLGSLEALEPSATVAKSNGTLLRGYTRYAISGMAESEPLGTY